MRQTPATPLASDGIEREAFDRWLNDKLCQLYGSVLREPIPDDLLDLIEVHRRDTDS